MKYISWRRVYCLCVFMETETLKSRRLFWCPFHKKLLKVSGSNGPTYFYYLVASSVSRVLPQPNMAVW